MILIASNKEHEVPKLPNYLIESRERLDYRYEGIARLYRDKKCWEKAVIEWLKIFDSEIDVAVYVYTNMGFCDQNIKDNKNGFNGQKGCFHSFTRSESFESQKGLFCQSKNTKKNGKKRGKQNYQCKECHRQFIGSKYIDNAILW